MVTALAIVALGVFVAWISGRTVFAFGADDPRIRTYLRIATAVSAFALVFGLIQLLFGPTGWLSTLDGSDPDDAGPLTAPFGGADLTGLALDSTTALVVGVVLGALLAAGAWIWASRGENARLFPVWVGGLTTGLVAAAISAPIAAGLFGGVTGAGTDARGRALPDARAERLPVGVRAGPDERSVGQDDQLHDRLRHPRRPAHHRADDV